MAAAAFTPRLTHKRRHSPDGTERRCSHCQEWWPEDGEFFNRYGPTSWQAWCKACCSERRPGKARQAGADQAADMAAAQCAIQAIIHAGIAADAATLPGG